MRSKGLPVLLLSSFVAAAGIFVSSGSAKVNAENEETNLMPKGWTYETLDDTGSSRIDTPYLSASAYKDPQKGNSLKLTRQISAYKLYATSEYFAATKGTAYKVEISARSECLDDDENILSISVLEKKTDGTVVTAEVGSISGRNSVWKSVSGYYNSSEDCESLAIRVSASGFGDYYVSGASVRGMPAPLMSLSNFAIESKEDATTDFEPLTSSYLSDDAASGEKSLHLDNKGFKMKLGLLPYGTYELSLKYKCTIGTRTSVRLDNDTMEPKRAWYAEPIPGNSTNGSWATYSYKFQRTTGKGVDGNELDCAIAWMQIFFFGDYYIDDLAIYDSEGYNYIPDGSFEGYDMPGVSFEGNVGLVKNKDGSLMYGGCYQTFNAAKNPVLTYAPSTLNLEDGKNYTLSYEYRNGWGTAFGSAKLGDTVLVDACDSSETWAKKEVSFVGAKNKPLTFSFGSGWGERLGYIKNISIKAEDGTECIKTEPKEFVTDPNQIGENVFEYGKFEYDFPDVPDSGSSSSSSSIDSIPGESSSEPSIPSTWEPTSSSSQSSSKPSDSQTQNNESNGNVSDMAMITIGSILVAIATGGLVVSVIFLAKGKKKDE